MFTGIKNILSTPKPDIILYVILIFFILFFIWASNAELEEVTRGNGKIIASSKLQVIQNLEGGIINDIDLNNIKNIKVLASSAEINTKFIEKLSNF